MNQSQLDKLKEVAVFVGDRSAIKEIEKIEQRRMQKNSELIVPLVGEFSSGKTSLINALTDSKQLETATKRTTATIYEVHFGCDHCHAVAIDEQGNSREFSNIYDLKNSELASAKVVTVFDTSDRVPSSTVIVDTPGLSSSDPKHKQTLVDFLPFADAILLVVDINPQLTRSLTDFIDTMKLSEKPIYLVLTKTDSKSPSEVEKAKLYIRENTKIAIENIVAVSAKENNLDELYGLLDSIQAKKNEIIARVDNQRARQIAQQLINHIDELLKASSGDKELEEAIDEQQYELEKIQSAIRRLLESTDSDIQDKERDLTRDFKDTVQAKLNALVAGKSDNFDAEAVSIINNTASLLTSQYRQAIRDILNEKARGRAKGLDDVSLSELSSINLDAIGIDGLSYDLDLNSAGHEHDGTISLVAKVGVAVAAVTAVVATGGTAAAGAAGVAEAGGAATASTAAETAISVGALADVADTATDVASMVSNSRTRQRIETAMSYAGKTYDKMQQVEQYNAEYGQQMGSKGIVESMVGFVTDKTWGKPQRLRAIRNYIDTSLAPEFKQSLRANHMQVITWIRSSLEQSAAELIAQKTSALQQMKTELAENKQQFAIHCDKLNEYKSELIILKKQQ